MLRAIAKSVGVLLPVWRGRWDEEEIAWTQSLHHPKQEIRLYRSTESQEVDSRVIAECYLFLRVFMNLGILALCGRLRYSGIRCCRHVET